MKTKHIVDEIKENETTLNTNRNMEVEHEQKIQTRESI